MIEEEFTKMLGIKYLNDEHDCNVVSMNSFNIHDANDMQSHKLGDAMFDEFALVRVGAIQTVVNPFPRRHLEPSPSECGR